MVELGAALSPEELYEITGYRQPAAQLRKLHDRGFWRAWRSETTGEVILERPHYDAVSRGLQPGPQPARRPQVRSTLHRVK